MIDPFAADLNNAQNAMLMVGIATHDALLATLQNQGTVTGSLKTVETMNNRFWFAPTQHMNINPLQWSLAVQAAYRAYGSSDSLTLAMSIWDAVSVSQITAENAANGTHPQKNGTFSQMCNGASTAGGVFRYADIQADTQVDGLSSSYNTGAWSYNTGFFIEGLSVYANVTQNSTWTTNLNKVLFTAINFPPLTRYDGIIIEDAKPSTTPMTFSNDFECGFKGIYMHGLFEVWTRTTDPKVKNFLQSYLFVQLNAILDLARLPGTNQFSSSWPGPYPLNLDACSQLAALEVFNAAIGLTPISNSTTPSPPPETSLPSSGPVKSTNVGLIVGVTIAAIVVLVALIVGFMWWRRRGRRASALRSRSSPLNETRDLAPTYAIEPFVAPISTGTSPATPQGYLSRKTRLPPTQPNSHSHTETAALLPGGARPNTDHSTRLDQGPPSITNLIPNHNQPSSHSRDPGQSQGGNDVADPSRIPQLIHTLNQALARLPPELVTGPVDRENPPEYMAM
ncbi:hypothetical protein NLI96_g1177 [Meripilus lineatus]|uniref:Glycoside hydrolase family 76 protein n=1 Tax=Meripilus lineatus TaxID=2056292 RepID=A0AAD5VAM1_9APHY|nr:hypothetical protein NLI96_g1177 [Physisporinus lineatus]